VVVPKIIVLILGTKGGFLSFGVFALVGKILGTINSAGGVLLKRVLELAKFAYVTIYLIVNLRQGYRKQYHRHPDNDNCKIFHNDSSQGYIGIKRWAL
jgi:hypothetical protein